MMSCFTEEDDTQGEFIWGDGVGVATAGRGLSPCPVYVGLHHLTHFFMITYLQSE